LLQISNQKACSDLYPYSFSETLILMQFRKPFTCFDCIFDSRLKNFCIKRVIWNKLFRNEHFQMICTVMKWFYVCFIHYRFDERSCRARHQRRLHPILHNHFSWLSIPGANDYPTDLKSDDVFQQFCRVRRQGIHSSVVHATHSGAVFQN